MPDKLILAEDAASPNREYDKIGRLHIKKSNISKAGVNGYFGREVPGGIALGLDPNRLYQFLRPAEELEKAAPTFARNPILSKHVPVTTKIFPKDLIVGTIGSDVTFEHPYLQSDLAFWTAQSIAGIESEQVRELSSSYHWVPVMTPGVYEGTPYDGIMTDIVGNHLAQVEDGRAGSDVLAADALPEISKMKMTKLGQALFVSLGTAFPKLAMDAALPALVGNATKKTFDKTAARTAILAMDADIKGEQVDNMLDALTDTEETPEPVKPPVKPAKDGDDKRGKLTEMMGDKFTPEELEQILGVACDEDDDDEEDDIAPAMDELRRELREANEARLAVRPIVGDLAMDSAPEVYRFALDHLKVDHKGVKELSGLKSLFTLASKADEPARKPMLAMDSKVVEQFPNNSRVRVR